jgi:hypothetical protein
MHKSPLANCHPHVWVLVYAEYVNILGGSIYTVKRSLKLRKETGPEVNAEKTKYIIMSQEQNAGNIYNIKIGNKSFERVEQFTYLGTTLTSQNSMHEKIKSRLKSGNACYHLVQNLLSSTVYKTPTKCTSLYHFFISLDSYICFGLCKNHHQGVFKTTYIYIQWYFCLYCYAIS